MKHRLLIFDWDGTLVDSRRHIVDSVKAACSATGERFPGEEATSFIIGLGMHEALTKLFGLRDEEFIRVFREAYSKHFFSIPPDRNDLFPGALLALQEFRHLGYYLAIATGKSRRGMDIALQAMEMEHWFKGVRCADETRSKPDPQMLSELLELFNLRPDQALMIGDTEYDMDMAKRMDMPRVAVSYGVHNIDRLRCFEPSGIADKPLELVGIVRQLAE